MARGRGASGDSFSEPAEGAQHLQGHANLSITLDRYGHPMPGNEDEAAALLDGYLARSMADAGRAALVAAA